MPQDLEGFACSPLPVEPNGFNADAVIPYGCKIEHIRKAMGDFLDFLGFVNQQLATRKILRLESFLMPANFSSMVGEFMTAAIPKYCTSWSKIATTTAIPTWFLRASFPATPFCTQRTESKSRLRVTGAVGRDTMPKTFG